jgi:hypothetical protein
MAVRGPNANKEADMIKAFIDELESPVFFDDNGTVHLLICCVCDTIARVDVAMEWIAVHSLRRHCPNTMMTKTLLTNVYPAALVAQYTAPNVPYLEDFVLSPANVHDPTQDTIAICELCANHFKSQDDVCRDQRIQPDEAIFSAYLIGDAPTALTDLNEVELALLSTVRTRWHTFYGVTPKTGRTLLCQQ